MSQYSVTGKMLSAKPKHRRYRPIPNVIGVRCQAEKTATNLQHPVDAGQHRSLVEHMLEGTDTNRQIHRLIRDSVQLLGVAHFKRNIGFPS